MPEHSTHHGYQIRLADAVYEPAEDSYLLIDAARGEIAGSKQRLRIIEIGTGSGIVTAAMMRDAPEHRYAATDISPHAVTCARANRVPVIRADLFSGIRGRFDLIVFNQPSGSMAGSIVHGTAEMTGEASSTGSSGRRQDFSQTTGASCSCSRR